VRIALLVGLAACGRLDFAEHVDASDAARDTPTATGHDEDGDGIPDSIDPCPHVAIGGMTDTDGDGVGDACDANPTTPSEHWLLFATMQPGDTAFDDLSAATQEADSVRFASDQSPAVTMTLNHARIDLGWTANALLSTASMQHQVAFGIDAAVQPEYYFCELNDNTMGLHDAAVVSYDMTNGYVQIAQMDPGAFHTGAGYTRLDTGTTMKLETGWTAQIYDVTAATPSYGGGTSIRFAFNGLDVSIRYLAIISSN